VFDDDRSDMTGFRSTSKTVLNLLQADSLRRSELLVKTKEN